MPDKHPSFQNPQIQEAICEIRFQMPDNKKWQPEFFGEYFNSIQQDFPYQEPFVQFGIRMQAEQKGVEQTFLPAQQWVRYKHKSVPLILQLTENILTINVLPDYPGWEIMSKFILDYWKKFYYVINPEQIIRIGLRYINRIERKKADELPEIWLKTSDYIPKAVLSSRAEFISHLDFYKDKNRIKVTLAEINNEILNKKDIMFDIDCIAQKTIKIDDEKDIVNEINILHDMAWEVFSASLTTRLRNILEGKKYE